jgi:hypothetical protein
MARRTVPLRIATGRLQIAVAHPTAARRAVLHPADPTSADPAEIPVDHLRIAAALRLTSADPAALPVDPISADPAAHPVDPTSATRTTMIGGRRGIRRTTIGGAVSTAPRGVTDCRRGAGAHRRHRRGMDRCHPRGAHRHRRSTTSVTTSNRCGIRATTSGVSGSSGSGFRSRSSYFDLKKSGRGGP